MERESFEDDITAELLNNSFVSIKVDREERPDVDKVYVSATAASTVICTALQPPVVIYLQAVTTVNIQIKVLLRFFAADAVMS